MSVSIDLRTNLSSSTIDIRVVSATVPPPRSGYERSKEFASMGAQRTDRWSPPQTSSVPISSRLTSYRGGNVTMVARLVYWTLVV